MRSERWRRVESLYHAALAQPADSRTAFLARECAGDEPLQREVESLLAQSDASNFLDSPAVAGLSRTAGLSAGHRLGVYEIVSPLGAGGMGEVYRARDTLLPREVAIKILPTVFASDPGRLARFEREARVLASLNNSHIASIYGVERMGGSRALVLELVEGPTLADRIAAGPIPIAEALRIAGQIADALDAAHEQGIVHRDLKPANVKLRPDGVVKVLDFGLAKVTELDADRATAAPATGSSDGAIVGTAAYMSPEQARGQAVDKRTDVWAFGCVLYEMLTGKTAFTGETASDVIANVLQREPEWADLPDDSPAPVRRLIERCLEKDPRRRLRDIGDAQIDLHETALRMPLVAVRARPRWLRSAIAVAAVIGAAMAGVALERARGARSGATPGPARLTIALPPGEQLAEAGNLPLAMSPNGEYVAFEAARQGNIGGPLYLRPIGEPNARLIVDAAKSPFFSPDSEWLGFFQDGKMKKVSVHGGVPVTITDSPNTRGASWGDDGYIVFTPLSRTGLSRVSAAGGVPDVLTTVDQSRGETSHRQPFVLRGGRAVIYRAEGSQYAEGAIVAYSLDSRQQRVLVKDGGYQPTVTQSGHLLYAQTNGQLLAAPFDVSTLQVTGPPGLVADGTEMYGASQTGSIVYGVGATTRSTLVWVDRRGTIVALPAEAQEYRGPRLSHDGRRIVVGIARHVWTYDIDRDAFARLTFDGSNLWPLWSPDDRRIIYASNRPGTAWDIFSRAADGTGTADVLLAGPMTEIPRALSADGASLMLSRSYPNAGQDLWLLRIGDKEPSHPFPQTSGVKMEPAFSPNGRWIAYASSERGRMEVYVRPLSGAPGLWQISPDGGVEPVWARSGKELFFRTGEKMFVVDVNTEPVFSAGKPRLLFEGKFALGTVEDSAYDVSADGQRFLMLKPAPPHPEPLNVLLNWSEELKRLTHVTR